MKIATHECMGDGLFRIPEEGDIYVGVGAC
jgi:hypothetical protein